MNAPGPSSSPIPRGLEIEVLDFVAGSPRGPTLGELRKGVPRAARVLQRLIALDEITTRGGLFVLTSKGRERFSPSLPFSPAAPSSRATEGVSS